MQEILAAIDEMVKNPPLYEIQGPDGPVTQKWRGMPKLPDLIETILSQRTKAQEARRRQESQDWEKQFAEMERDREAHPERYISLKDVVKGFSEKHPEKAAALGLMPSEPREMTDEDFNRRQQELDRQREQLGVKKP